MEFPLDVQDSLERHMGKRLEEMSPAEMVRYIKTYVQVVHDVDLPSGGIAERSVMGKLVRAYGARDAARIIKWALIKHGGVVDGDPIGYFSFASGRRWWTDKMLIQARLAQKSAATRSSRRATSTTVFATPDDL